MSNSDDEAPGKPVAVFPVLPLRDIVVFPHKIVPLFVGREKSVRALEDVGLEERQILLVTQKNPTQDEPGENDIYRIGTLASVVQLLKLPDQTVRVLVEGKQRARIKRFIPNGNFFQVEAEILPDIVTDDGEIEALARTASAQFDNYVKLNKKIAPESQAEVQQIQDPSKLADTIASHLTAKIPDKQGLLEMVNVGERLEKVFGLMEAEMSVLQVERKIRTRVKRQMEKTQREYYLNEQLKAIQKELGDGSHNEHFSLGFDLLEAAVQRGQVGTVEHLGSLHAGPRGNVQAGHISTNIRIADNGK